MNIYSIYKVTNLINNKVYIGFDSNWPNRQNQHKLNYTKLHFKFYNAIKKYGWDNFVWEIIYQSRDGDYTLKTMESFFIEQHNSFEHGYNSTKGGDGVLGHIHSNTTKEKIGLSKRGRKFAPQTRTHKENISIAVIANSKFYYIMISPEGEKISTNSLRRFCKENNLNCGHMVSVSKNRLKHHKKWKCVRILL